LKNLIRNNGRNSLQTMHMRQVQGVHREEEVSSNLVAVYLIEV